MKKIKGKTAVLTGSNRGIGKTILEVFARNGANIWACVRKPDDNFTDYIANLTKETGVSIQPVYFDLADAEQVKRGARTIISAKQPIDVLINNAGIVYNASFLMTPVDKMKEVFEINYFSQMLLTQYIVRIMARQKSGSIINISSITAIEGYGSTAAYGSSKAALICSTKVMAKELAAYNIRVNAIAPGFIETAMMRKSAGDALENILQRTCLKRIGRPKEVANAVLFLASDSSSYITGQILRVDGGM